MSEENRPPLTPDALALVATRFKVLGDSTRLAILQQLRRGERSVSDLVAALGLAQSSVSKHLKTLREEGIVSRRQEGPAAIYSISDPVIWKLCGAVCDSLIERDERRSDAFRRSGIEPRD
jgi:ArsR family transcriptional regulator, arsenate/arsenite/antimonite-responsive transcriptional repressor